MHIHLLSILGVGIIIASDLIDWMLQMALKFGANHTVNPQCDDLTRNTQERTGRIGTDLAVVAVGSAKEVPYVFSECLT